MLRTWGGVPLCDKPDVLMTSEIAQLSKERATEQATWQFIRDDVDRSCEIYDKLGFGNFKSRNCYWNKAASYCLKAEVYLWGAKVRPLKGSAVFSPTPEADLAEAQQALQTVEALYACNDKFIDAFSPTNKDSNRETIFAVRYKLGEKTNFYSNFTYNVSTFTKWYDLDGNKLGNVLNIGSGAMRYEYTLDFYRSFAAADTRRDATFLPFCGKDNDGELVPAGLVLRKFLGETDNGRVQYTNDLPVYRYMDVALMLAEIATSSTNLWRWSAGSAACAPGPTGTRLRRSPTRRTTLPRRRSSPSGMPSSWPRASAGTTSAACSAANMPWSWSAATSSNSSGRSMRAYCRRTAR